MPKLLVPNIDCPEKSAQILYKSVWKGKPNGWQTVSVLWKLESAEIIESAHSSNPPHSLWLTHRRVSIPTNKHLVRVSFWKKLFDESTEWFNVINFSTTWLLIWKLDNDYLIRKCCNQNISPGWNKQDCNFFCLQNLNMSKLQYNILGGHQGSVGRDDSSWDGPRPSSSSGRDGTRTR